MSSKSSVSLAKGSCGQELLLLGDLLLAGKHFWGREEVKTASAVPCLARARLRHNSPPPLQLFPVWKEIPAGLAAPWPARAPALPAPLAASPGAAAGACPAPLPARTGSLRALPAPSPTAPRGTAASSTASLMAPAL